LDLDASRVQEVDLLLALVEVAPRLDAGREHDRVHPERVDAEGGPDLAKARTVAEVLQVRDGPAVAGDDVVHAPTVRLGGLFGSPVLHGLRTGFCAQYLLVSPTSGRAEGLGEKCRRRVQAASASSETQHRVIGGKALNAYRHREVVQ